jgi:hypothetical protein
VQGAGSREQECWGKARFVKLLVSTPISSKIEEILGLEFSTVGFISSVQNSFFSLFMAYISYLIAAIMFLLPL